MTVTVFSNCLYISDRLFLPSYVLITIVVLAGDYDGSIKNRGIRLAETREVPLVLECASR
jgi:hypothetical protein